MAEQSEQEHTVPPPVDVDVDDVAAVEEEQAREPPVTIRLPAPTCSQTLPRAADGKSPTPSTFLIHPQPGETIQDIRAVLAEWTGGYWLGPYSLRLKPAVEAEKEQDGRGKVVGVGKEGTEIRQGERLSDWLELSEVFAHLDSSSDGAPETTTTERVLYVQREPYSEHDARHSVLRLREYMMPPSEGNRTFAPVGVAPAATIFEGIVDGSLVETDRNAQVGKVKQHVQQPGKKNKLGARPPVAPGADSTATSALFEDFPALPSTSLSTLPTNLSTPAHPSCVRSLIFSPFNPPAPQYRQRGHLVYLTLVTLEGDAYMLVCTTRGWHVAKSTAPSVSFDPTPREGANNHAHSLVDLLHALSPQFTATLRALQTSSSSPTAREPITTVPVPQHPSSYPWLIKRPSDSSAQQPDLLRTQLAFGYTGAVTPDGLEAAREWNEELSSARELPRGNPSERMTRERMLQKTHAEFTAACVRGAMAIARGDVAPINPYEEPRAHMFLAGNIFFTKGVNSVDAYTHLGGDEAARVSHGKDAQGVRALNKLDVDGLYLLGHTIVDWQGERWVCQSVLPGIFTRRREDPVAEASAVAEDTDKEEKKAEAGDEKKETSVEASADAITTTALEPEHNLIIYGADSEAGASHLHWDAATHTLLEHVGNAFHLAEHTMTDARGHSHPYWTSVDVKGLRGSDGRRYLLDLPRLSPVDVEWLEKDLEGPLVGGAEGDAEAKGKEYPHRVVLLRSELLDAYWDHELKLWARKLQADNIAKKEEDDKRSEEGKKAAEDKIVADAADPAVDMDAEEEKKRKAAAAALEERRPDQLRFDLRFNADAFVEQQPPAPSATDETAATAPAAAAAPSTQTDESEPAIKAVRDASVHLRNVAIPAVVIDIIAANTFGIMDGASLAKHLHSRGINMRYLGYFVATVDKFIAQADGQSNGQLKAIRAIATQEMVFRGAKHILRSLLHGLSAEHSIYALTHFLNCLFGAEKNANPTAIFEAYDFLDMPVPAYTKLTPEALRQQIIEQVQARFRWKLDESFLTTGMKKQQLLRELATRTAFQLEQREYSFSAAAVEEVTASEQETASGKAKKSKKSKADVAVDLRLNTFEPSDIVTLLPVIKSCAPSASIAEEVFETGRHSINRSEIPLGLELMLEGINMYEQIHQVIHPEVAAAYNQYAVAMHQLVRLRIQQLQAEGNENEDLNLDINTAIKLQRQAIIVAERTLGIHHAETISYYYNLAMLENLQGNADIALRLLKHVLALWDVVYGPDHPELPSILIHVALILQTQTRHAAAVRVLEIVHQLSIKLFGADHIMAGTAMSQLTQAHFLNGDLEKALECAKISAEIYKQRFGEDDAQSQEAAKNVELLTGALEQNSRAAQVTEEQLKKFKALQEQARQQGGVDSKQPIMIRTAPPPGANGLPAVDGQQPEGEMVDLDALVNFIQGKTSNASSSSKTRGKTALRGKKRTGAKR
ncbi:hypothetical protein QFC21_003774 [Naganishia friedmannii]|uniref:Uncharacterized protein n=1 Tax=Naganishia friedmannii TaxID=89922 RepID=A0ACC2VMC6_9TREE|nr:hypothetical protein QFC21_003774 [Naganishia friedmannii]